MAAQAARHPAAGAPCSRGLHAPARRQSALAPESADLRRPALSQRGRCFARAVGGTGAPGGGAGDHRDAGDLGRPTVPASPSALSSDRRRAEPGGGVVRCAESTLSGGGAAPDGGVS